LGSDPLGIVKGEFMLDNKICEQKLVDEFKGGVYPRELPVRCSLGAQKEKEQWGPCRKKFFFGGKGGGLSKKKGSALVRVKLGEKKDDGRGHVFLRTPGGVLVKKRLSAFAA